MRPCLRPGVRVWWRRVDAVQLGIGEHSQLITGLPVGSATLFRLLDGTRELADIATTVFAATGLAPERVAHIVTSLVDLGVLYDAGALPRLDGLPLYTRDRLRSEALSWVEGTDPAHALDRRRAAQVRVLSCDPTTVATAALLAASGVGHFAVSSAPDESELVQADDILPGGLSSDVLGTPRVSAVRQALAQLGAETRAQKVRPDANIALLSFQEYATTTGFAAPEIPYVTTSVSGRSAVVGPLVIPGITACAVCESMSREDRDAALVHDDTEGLQPPIGLAAAAVTAVQLAAVHAAVAVLEFLDQSNGARLPALAGHVLHIDVPGPTLQLSVVRPHPRCGCCWDAA